MSLFLDCFKGCGLLSFLSHVSFLVRSCTYILKEWNCNSLVLVLYRFADGDHHRWLSANLCVRTIENTFCLTKQLTLYLCSYYTIDYIVASTFRQCDSFSTDGAIGTSPTLAWFSPMMALPSRSYDYLLKFLLVGKHSLVLRGKYCQSIVVAQAIRMLGKKKFWISWRTEMMRFMRLIQVNIHSTETNWRSGVVVQPYCLSRGQVQDDHHSAGREVGETAAVGYLRTGKVQHHYQIVFAWCSSELNWLPLSFG